MGPRESVFRLDKIGWALFHEMQETSLMGDGRVGWLAISGVSTRGHPTLRFRLLIFYDPFITIYNWVICSSVHLTPDPVPHLHGKLTLHV